MRLHRLRLANYRGIDESEVRFGSQGLTIVEGPNEAGKTSLGEAIGLLFDFLDSSKHQIINAIKPVHHDVGAEIELEAESGHYVFTYFKRFHKKPETTLTITSPKQENHTGREAHERAEEILRETIDIDLWKALCIQQGEAIQQADLSKQTSLLAALDMAAGGHRTDPREGNLFDRVQEEYERYFTRGGREKKESQVLKTAQEKAETEIDALEKQIRNLEKDINRAAELHRELKDLRDREQELQIDVSEYTKALDEIKDLETALETARLKLESAQKSEQVAKRDKEARQNLIDTVSKVSKARAKLDESSTSLTAPVKKAENDLKKSQSDSASAEVRRKEAEALLNLRRADVDYFNDKLHLEQMKERKERIDRAREEAVIADELLMNNRVDKNALKAIRKTEDALISAQSKLDMEAPQVLLRGLAEFDLQIDGEQITIAKDEEQGRFVSDRIRVTIPGAVEMEVTAGSSTASLLNKVEEAQQKLETVCRNAGVGSSNEAGIAYDERQAALRSLENKNRIESDNLRDLTYEQLESRVIGLERSIPAYFAARIQEPEFAPDLESAKKESQNATNALEKIDGERGEALVALDSARKVRDRLREQHQKVIVELDLKTTELKHAEDDLTRSRRTTSDDDLESNLTRCINTAKLEEENVRFAETALSGKEPDRVRILADTAKGSLQTVKKKYAAAQKEDTEVRERLKFFGEEGLHEKLLAAQSRLEHVRQENAAMTLRASAAELLYLTMKEERDKVRRAYVAPLKEKIERLGRLVFNDSFTVEVTEQLSIAGRALGGFTVPFDSLSGGTREQLSLITRLACAMIVSKDGGAPLILDDALGYTDPERLKVMGAVLARAGRECQIIILTCVPDRYSNVGEAVVVRLG